MNIEQEINFWKKRLEQQHQYIIKLKNDLSTTYFGNDISHKTHQRGQRIYELQFSAMQVKEYIEAKIKELCERGIEYDTSWNDAFVEYKRFYHGLSEGNEKNAKKNNQWSWMKRNFNLKRIKPITNQEKDIVGNSSHK